MSESAEEQLARVTEELEELKRHLDRCDLEDFRYIRRLQIKNKKLERKLKDAEAAAREEERERCVEILKGFSNTRNHGQTVAAQAIERILPPFKSVSRKEAIRALAGEEGEG